MTDPAPRPAPGTVLCRLDDLAEGVPRGLVLGSGTARLDLILLRQGGTVRAWRNQCPHAGSPLDLLPDRFLAADGHHLQCHTHGALFRPEDGMCVAGPCRGRALVAVALRLAAGEVRLA